MHSRDQRLFRSLVVATLLSVPFPALSACVSSDVEQPPPAPVDPRIYQQTAMREAAVHKTAFETEQEALDGFGRAIAQNDAKALAPLFDPDADMSFPGMAHASDRDGLLKSMADLLGPFTERKYTPSRIWLSGEAAVVEWTMLATQSGEWMSVKASGKHVGIKGITLFWFKLNGLVTDMHVYFDVGAVLAQLGAAPKGIEAPVPSPITGAPEVFLAGGNEQEKKNVHDLNASFDALEAKNEAGFLAPFADGVEVYRLDRAAPEHGKDERRKFAKWVTHGLSSLAQNPTNAWGVGPYAIEEYTITGVHSGPIAGTQPSGRSLELHYVDVMEMKDDKILRVWTYGNSMELLAQMGAVPHASP
jgi:predicted ester cyclase